MSISSPPPIIASPGGVQYVNISTVALFVCQISIFVYFAIHCNVKNVRVDMGKVHSGMQSTYTLSQQWNNDIV